PPSLPTPRSKPTFTDSPTKPASPTTRSPHGPTSPPPQASTPSCGARPDGTESSTAPPGTRRNSKRCAAKSPPPAPQPLPQKRPENTNAPARPTPERRPRHLQQLQQERYLNDHCAPRTAHHDHRGPAHPRRNPQPHRPRSRAADLVHLPDRNPRTARHCRPRPPSGGPRDHLHGRTPALARQHR